MSVRFGLAYDFRNPERWERPWGEVFHALLEQIEYVDTLKTLLAKHGDAEGERYRVALAAYPELEEPK